jgi:hypothetical protein
LTLYYLGEIFGELRVGTRGVRRWLCDQAASDDSFADDDGAIGVIGVFRKYSKYIGHTSNVWGRIPYGTTFVAERTSPKTDLMKVLSEASMPSHNHHHPEGEGAYDHNLSFSNRGDRVLRLGTKFAGSKDLGSQSVLLPQIRTA